MKIGIIVHSNTGNTLSVAKRLEKTFSENGHRAKVKKLKLPEDFKPGSSDIEFLSVPSLDKYDCLVFGSPVEAFSLSAVMVKYLKEKAPSLKGRKGLLYVTKALPFNWTGGNRAIKQMKKLVSAKGGKVMETGIVVWKEKHREGRIADVVERFTGSL